MSLSVAPLAQVERALHQLSLACISSPASKTLHAQQLSSNVPSSAEQIVPCAIRAFRSLETDFTTIQKDPSVAIQAQTATILKQLNDILHNILPPCETVSSPLHERAQEALVAVRKTMAVFHALERDRIEETEQPPLVLEPVEPPPPEEQPPSGWLSRLLSGTVRTGATLFNGTKKYIHDHWINLIECKHESSRQTQHIQAMLLAPQQLSSRIIKVLLETDRDDLAPQQALEALVNRDLLLKEALQRTLAEEPTQLLSQKALQILAAEIADTIDMNNISAQVLKNPSQLQLNRLIGNEIGKHLGHLPIGIQQIVTTRIEAAVTANVSIQELLTETPQGRLQTALRLVKDEADIESAIACILSDNKLQRLITPDTEEPFRNALRQHLETYPQGSTRRPFPDTNTSEIVRDSATGSLAALLRSVLTETIQNLPEARVEPVIEKILSRSGRNAEEQELLREPLTEALQATLRQSDDSLTTRLTFAHNLSLFIVSFLEEQLLHITERDREFNSPFLKRFFEDPTAEHPQPTMLGKFLIPLLENNGEFARELVRANVLRALDNGYRTLEAYQENNPDLLVTYVHAALEITAQATQKEKDAQIKSAAALWPDSREPVLNGTLQNRATGQFLDICFPKHDLFLPTCFCKSAAWNALEGGVGNVISDFLMNATQFQDIRQSLLMQGLEATTGVLSGESAEATAARTTQRQQTRRGGVIAVGMIVAFIKIFFDVIKESLGRRTATTPSEYPDQDAFNRLIHTIYRAIAQDTLAGRIVPERLSRKLSDHISKSITSAIRKIPISKVLDNQLDVLSEKFRPDSREQLFPRTREEQRRAEEAKQEQRERDQESISLLEREFGNNIEGLIATIHSWLKYPEGNRTGNPVLDTIRTSVKNFANACIETFVRFFLWMTRARTAINRWSRQAVRHTHLVPQDVVIVEVVRRILNDLNWRPRPSVSNQEQ